ncbi:MAG: hypothetical protein K2G75_06030, partial [Muribaculaceae bacterium]|nr:hypothetical protein [Muribaculaceae bacterium]
VKDVRGMGRATQGVKLIDLSKRGDTIASVCKVDSDPESTAEREAEEELRENAEAENRESIDTLAGRIEADEERIIDDELDELDREIPDELESAELEAEEESLEDALEEGDDDDEVQE